VDVCGRRYYTGGGGRGRAHHEFLTHHSRGLRAHQCSRLGALLQHQPRRRLLVGPLLLNGVEARHLQVGFQQGTQNSKGFQYGPKNSTKVP
jgi:hypothetical protein